MAIDRTPGTRCALCDRLASDAHHLTYRGRGGTDAPENILPLCHDDHMAEHRHEICIEVFGRDGVDWLRVTHVPTGDLLVNRPLHWRLDELVADVSHKESVIAASWALTAQGLYEAYTGWLMRDEGGNLLQGDLKVKALAKTFHVHPKVARQRVQVAKAFWPVEGDEAFADRVLNAPFQHFDVWRTCARQQDPEAALQRAIEKATEIENASTEVLNAAIEQRAPRDTWVRFPGTPEWFRLADLETERRERTE